MRIKHLHHCDSAVTVRFAALAELARAAAPVEFRARVVCLMVRLQAADGAV